MLLTFIGVFINFFFWRWQPNNNVNQYKMRKLNFNPFLYELTYFSMLYRIIQIKESQIISSTLVFILLFANSSRTSSLWISKSRRTDNVVMPPSVFWNQMHFRNVERTILNYISWAIGKYFTLGMFWYRKRSLGRGCRNSKYGRNFFEKTWKYLGKYRYTSKALQMCF